MVGKIVQRFYLPQQKDPKYPNLTPGQPYVVIGTEGDEFRLLSDSGRPYLYPPVLFCLSDQSESRVWVSEFGERYA